MQQPSLLTHHELQSNFEAQQVNASFTLVADKMHDVVLNINSHKFLIRIKTGLQKLEHFEVIAVRGFVEMGMKIVSTLKRIVSVLYFQA